MKTLPRRINERFNKLSLRAKLTFGFLLVLSSTVIVGATSLFIVNRGAAAIERLLDTETRIADISRQSEVAVRLTRQNEKDFLLQYRVLGFDEAKARYATLLKVEVAEIHQNMDAIRQLVADESVISETRTVDQAIDQFEMKFLATTELIKQRGFFDVGAEGQFRRKIQQVEAILTQQHAPNLLVDMLTLRRREKNFLLRDRREGAVAVKESAIELQHRIAGSDLQPDVKEALRRLVSDYQALFEEYVQLDDKITTETEIYRTVIHSVEPPLGQVRAWALQRAEASREQVLQSSRTNGRIVFVTVPIATVLGLLLTFFISRSIAGGVNEVMVFAGRLAQGDLGARMKRASHDEFGAIATALNRLAEQLQKNRDALLAENTERKRAEAELEMIHKQLVNASRRAGMAEVATGVLHNVGNVLNSVNVSTAIVVEQLQKSRISRLTEVAKLLADHAANLPEFLTIDERGRNLPEFLAQLAAHLNRETREMAEEMRAVSENVEHIKGIVHTQQSYAGSFGVLEPIDLRESIEDALRINSAALNRHEVDIVRKLEAIPAVVVDKHKVLQILVNLISNAKYAMSDSPVKTLTLRTCLSSDGGIQLSIHDTGSGIAAENITRIFAHGFTTKRDGHGFGLHSSALAAKEMNAMLIASSDGAGQGAVFTLVFPPAVPERVAA
ncbi:MAG: two-component system, NtrC family, sensor kinase [Phycisphaerales bacterium]|nr:two-component system, NtrC family, sensor kinase [Phycisphaerales bacterium]